MTLRCLFLALLPLGLAIADEPRTRGGLSEAQAARLQRDKVLVTQQEFPQVFMPYLRTEMPVFITSDAVLNTYHVLLEESMVRVMARQSERLTELLEAAWTKLPGAIEHTQGDDSVRTAAGARATRVLAVALRLLDLPTPGLSEADSALVSAEVEEIVAARGVRTPEWLGADDSELRLDYSRFQPRGFSLRSERLQRTWRAMSWLQAVPFRVKNHEELMAILMIGWAMPDAERGTGPLRKFLAVHDAFLGLPDNPDVGTAADIRWADVAEPDAAFSNFSWPKARLRDQPGRENDSIPDQFRILGAAALPEAVLFQKTTLGPRGEVRPKPAALEVPMLLGSALAAQELASEPAWVTEVIDGERGKLPLFTAARVPWERTVHEPWMASLQALLRPSDDPRVPAFMRGDPWARKSCATVLGSWVQMRRTFALHAKRNGAVFCGKLPQPGFVEPNPEFWQRLTDVVLVSTERLLEAGAFDGETDEEVWQDLRCLRRLLTAEAPHNGEGETTRHGDEGHARLDKVDVPFAAVIDEATARRLQQQPESPEKEEAWRKLLAREELAKLDALEARLATAPTAIRRQLLDQMKLPEEQPLRGLWFRFQRVVLTLERLAEKQLNQTEFTAAEKQFIDNIGHDLGACQLYLSNTYEAPRDDTMKVIDVFSGPQGLWHVGIGRPRALHVLYPWKGQEIHCIGAVLPFLETNEPAPLDDAAWKARLDGPPEQRPTLPEWYAPIVVGKE